MPWNLKLSALCAEDPSRLSRFLSGALFVCGGRVVSRSRSDREVRMNFEFERSRCVEVYSALIAAGLELSDHSHQRLTELCQCTRHQQKPIPSHTVEVELEVVVLAPATPAQNQRRRIGDRLS